MPSPRLLTLALLAFTPGALFAAAPALPTAPPAEEILALGLPDTIAPDAKVTQLANGFLFTEGATSAPNGDVFFVDQPNDKILRWDVATSTLHTFLNPAGRSNGHPRSPTTSGGPSLRQAAGGVTSRSAPTTLA